MAKKKTEKAAKVKVKAIRKPSVKKGKIDFYQFVFLVCMAVIAIFGAVQVGMSAGR